MTHRRRIALDVCLIGLLAASAPRDAAAAVALYVSADGNDTWSGRLPDPNAARDDGPFATLPRARDAVRALLAEQGGKPSEPITVYLRGGVHALGEPLTFTPVDSGTADAPITYRAFNNERAVVSGGERITNWKRGDGELWQAELPEVANGTWDFRTLRVGNDWAIRARYPNCDANDPIRGGWLFAQWWGPDWQRGLFDVAVTGARQPGDWLAWEIEAPVDRTFYVWLRYAYLGGPTWPETMDNRTTLQIDDEDPVPLQHLPKTDPDNPFRWSLAAEMPIGAGPHKLVWKNVKGGPINLDAICLTDDPNWDPGHAIRVRGWWGEYEVVATEPGTGVLIIQAEACTAKHGRTIDVPKATLPGTRNRIPARPEDIPNYLNWDGAEIHIFPAFGWTNEILPLKLIRHDINSYMVICDRDIRPGNRYFIENVLEALDSPGEWHLSKDRGVLRYWPAAPGFPDVEVRAPRVDRLFVLKGDLFARKYVEHIRFEDLTFTDADYGASGSYSSSDAAIWLSTARHCRIAHCTFDTLAGHAVRLENRSTRNAIVRNTMRNLGQGGVIMLGAVGTQPTENLVAANDIHDIGRFIKHVAGVYCTTGSGNRIAHNRIHRSPRYGISLKSYSRDSYSHDNIVEYNEIIDTNLETNDSGAIETLGRDRQLSGNVIRYNVIRNTGGLGVTSDNEFLWPYFTWGIYLDDYSSGTTVTGNVVVDSVIGAICIHGGKANVFENNVFVDGLERQITLQPRDDFMTGNVFRRNIVKYDDPATLLWFSWPHTWKPNRLSECDRNLYWCTEEDVRDIARPITPAGSFKQWQKVGFDRNSLVADPKFKAPAEHDYRLADDSPAAEVGFKPIPFDRIGPAGYQEPDPD
jgi:parallel beta-helix repeat protein